jgi:hypothetical protein
MFVIALIGSVTGLSLTTYGVIGIVENAIKFLQ